ncbi:MAG TPA: Hpt domain-containing protein, partial [Spirochaetales bacterium]|nr:Hpt domain-containing protein [Spirochaetales bacterium]
MKVLIRLIIATWQAALSLAYKAFHPEPRRTSMALSKEKFLTLFLDEFAENILVAENQIILLKNDSNNADALATLLRTLHTIKGSTRMLQFNKMESLVHGAETVFKGIREGRYTVDARLVRFFFIIADHLRYAAKSIAENGDESLPSLGLLSAACERLSANEAFDLSSIPALALQTSAQESLGPAPSQNPSKNIDKNAALSSNRHEHNPLSKTNETATTIQDGNNAHENLDKESSIRVDAATIDRAINLVNTMTVRQLRLRSAVDQIENFQRDLSKTSNLDLSKTAKRNLAELARAMRLFKSQYSDQLFEIDHGMQELRETVIGMRMLPLSVILDRFPRMVEETASSLGKEVCISISGDGVRLDRTVMEKLSDPLIHLIRNSVDHGIESKEKRIEAGKPTRGSIRLDCKTEGNRISVSVSDDGAGFDYQSIRERAIGIWPEEESDIRSMGEEELTHFLFKPGSTTRANSNALSGRGIGL